jgi:hypothetical protein
MITLSIIAKTRGAAFIITHDDDIIDFGIKRFRSSDRLEAIISEIIAWVEVGDIKQVLVNQIDESLDTQANKFMADLSGMLRLQNVKVITVTNDDLKHTFKFMTRTEIAQMLSGQIDILPHLLTPKKKLWESESANMLIFDAAAQMRVKGII